MAVLAVHINKSSVLRRKAKPVKVITAAERKLFDDMLETMYKSKGVGLAAPQVGISKQMIVIDIGSGPLKLLNPKIIKKRGKCQMEEGCLSLPDVQVKVKRPKFVMVEAQDLSEKHLRIEAKGLLARVIQHEIDHLYGILLVDYMSWHKRLLWGRNINKPPRF